MTLRSLTLITLFSASLKDSKTVTEEERG